MNRVYLELTNRCNLICEMCYRNSWENTLGDMDKQLIDKISNELNDQTVVVFAGIGEPTIALNFKYAVEKLMNHELHITTNGIVTEEKLLLLCENFNKIIISVDGTDDDYYKIRKADFTKITKTLKFIKEYKDTYKVSTPSIDFAFVLTKRNKDSIYSVIDLAHKYKIDQILISHLLPQNDVQKKDIFYTLDYNHEGHDYINKVNKYAYFDNRVVVNFPYMEIKTERYCQFVENDYTYIDYLGDVIPCYRYANTYKEIVFEREKKVLKHSFGNIRSKSIADIYNDKDYTDFRNNVLNTKHPSCVDCDFEDGCSFVESTEFDCMSYSPSCADCLWNRNIIKCT